MSVPFFPQLDYQCGPAALATALAYEGLPIKPNDLIREVYIPKRKGSLQVDLISSIRRRDLQPHEIEPTLSGLLVEINAGNPVLVLQDLGGRLGSVWHYAVVVGYDSVEDVLILRSGHTRRKRISAANFDRSWQASKRWGLVVLAPGEMPARPSEKKYLAAAAALEPRLSPPDQIALYSAALEQWPDSDVAAFGLSLAYYSNRQFDDSEKVLRTLIARSPSNIPAHNNLAQLLAERGCRSEALKILDKVLVLSSAAPWLHALQKTREEVSTLDPNMGECGTLDLQ